MVIQGSYNEYIKYSMMYLKETKFPNQVFTLYRLEKWYKILIVTKYVVQIVLLS